MPRIPKITKKSHVRVKRWAEMIADTVTVQIISAEALLREEHPEVTKNVCYTQQYLLEEIIAILKERV